MLTREQTVTSRNTNLSDNFTIYELINSSGHPELVEYPSKEVIARLQAFCENVLQPIRDRWGRIRVSSGYRNPVLNKAVGGVSNSVHQQEYKEILLGVAVDIQPKEADINEVFDWIWNNLPELKTVIIYRKPSVTSTPFIHLDTRIGRPKRAKLEKMAPRTYIPVS